MEGNVNRNERASSKHESNQPLTMKHAHYLSASPDAHEFSKHAERMRNFRLAHSQIQTDKSEGSGKQLKLLSPLPAVEISVMLRNSRN